MLSFQPINESFRARHYIWIWFYFSAHWYLAIICYPHLLEPVRYNKTVIVQSKVTESAAKLANKSYSSNSTVKSAPATTTSSQSEAEKSFLSELKGDTAGEEAVRICSLNSYFKNRNPDI